MQVTNIYKIKDKYIRNGIILLVRLLVIIPITFAVANVSAGHGFYIFVARSGMEAESSSYYSEQVNNFLWSDDSSWGNDILLDVNSVVTIFRGTTSFYNIQTLDRLLKGYHQSNDIDECWEAYPYWEGRFSKFLDTLNAKKKSKCTAAYYLSSRNKRGYTEDHYGVVNSAGKYKILGYVRYNPATFALVQYIGD